MKAAPAPTAKAAEVHAGFALARVFTALKAHDVMCHGLVYPMVATMLQRRGGRLNFLDLGCGDGTDIVTVLKALQLTGYTGIDSSQPTLMKAQEHLASLSCPVRLLHGDYALAWTFPPSTFDVVWLGLFLHHVPTIAKLDFLTRIFGLLKPGGLLLAHDPLLKEDEDRTGFIERLERHGHQHWQFLTPEEMAVAGRHWRQHGHQEPYSALQTMGYQAGFSEVRLLWSDPQAFYGLVLFARGDERP